MSTYPDPPAAAMSGLERQYIRRGKMEKENTFRIYSKISEPGHTQYIKDLTYKYSCIIKFIKHVQDK